MLKEDREWRGFLRGKIANLCGKGENANGKEDGAKNWGIPGSVSGEV